METSRDRKGGGWIRKRSDNLAAITYEEWKNPFNFYSFLMAPIFSIISWMMSKGLLPSSMICQQCRKPCQMKENKSKVDKFFWRCRIGHGTKDRPSPNAKLPEFSRTVKHLSFFEKFRLPHQDVLNFIKQYLDKHSLLKCAIFANVDYQVYGSKLGANDKGYFCGICVEIRHPR